MGHITPEKALLALFLLNQWPDFDQTGIEDLNMSADLRKGSFGHLSSFCVIKISKTSKFSRFCMFLQ